MIPTPGKQRVMRRAIPWDLQSVRAQSGKEYGYSVILRIGDISSICVRPDTRVPTLFDKQTADYMGRTIDSALHGLYAKRQPIVGETRGGNEHNYVYFTIARDARLSFIFVVTDGNDACPKVRSFSMRKGALAILGEVIDRLAGGHVDWTRMIIPPENA